MSLFNVRTIGFKKMIDNNRWQLAALQFMIYRAEIQNTFNMNI